MDNRLGCNTLYPHGRLNDVGAQFTLDAQKQALHDIREAGFDDCEFSHSECLTLEQCDALREECAGIGLVPWSAHSWVSLPADPGRVEGALPKLMANLDATAHLGAEVMVVHAAGADQDMADGDQRNQRAEALKASLHPLSERAASPGISIAIENCGTRPDLEFLVETAAALALPNVGFNIDTGHAVLRQMEPASAIRLMGDRLLTTHLQDNFGERDDHLPPGLGTIDWASVVQAFRDVGYTRTLMVEISDCPPGREPVAKEDIRTSFDNVTRFVRGA